jgi:hypothetical protein
MASCGGVAKRENEGVMGGTQLKIDSDGTLFSLTGVLIERADGFGYQALTEFAENCYAS